MSVRDGRPRAVVLLPRQASIDHLADDEPPVGIERHPIRLAAVFSDDLRLAARRQSVDAARPNIHEQQIAVRMPQRALGEDEPRRQPLRVGGFENFAKPVRHDFASA